MSTIIIDEAKKLDCEIYSCFIKFNYNYDYVLYIKSLPTRVYDAEEKSWEVPFSYFDEIHKYFKDAGVIDHRKAGVKISEFNYKTTPFNHQTRGVEFGLSHEKWLLADEQGLGKSKQAIDIAMNRKSTFNYHHCLVVCGVNSLKWNWQNEIAEHSNETAHILGQRQNRKGIVKIGSVNERIKDLDMIEELPYFIITNIESFRDSNFADKIQALCRTQIQMVVFDECHKAKAHNSQQTKGFIQCKTKCQIAMTGTPIMNNPIDLYVILKWLGYENHSFYTFKNHYCVMGGYGGYEIIGYKNMEQLSEVTQRIMLRRLKKDVLDLPDKIYITDYVDMLPKQAIIYKEVLEDIKKNIDKVEISPSPLAALIRLRQATGYTGILSSEIQESAKIDRLEELVENAVASDDKVIIFSNWTLITDEVYKRMKQYNPAIITGDTKDNERQNEQDKFTHDTSCKVIIGSIGAMGTGITLTAGTTVIFLDEPWNKALFDQAVDRAHRIGTKSNVTIYSIICKNTIDEKVHKLIYKKGKLSEAMIDDTVIDNKTDTINYLLS